MPRTSATVRQASSATATAPRTGSARSVSDPANDAEAGVHADRSVPAAAVSRRRLAAAVSRAGPRASRTASAHSSTVKGADLIPRATSGTRARAAATTWGAGMSAASRSAVPGRRGRVPWSAGGRPGGGSGGVGEAGVVRHRLGAFPPVLAPEVEGTEGDVVTRGRPHDLVAEVLEHVADVPGDLADGAMGRAAAVAPDRARDVAVPEVRDEPVEGLAQR